LTANDGATPAERRTASAGLCQLVQRSASKFRCSRAGVVMNPFIMGIMNPFTCEKGWSADR
jgi:hypothetical protein